MSRGYAVIMDGRMVQVICEECKNGFGGEWMRGLLRSSGGRRGAEKY